MTDLPSPFLVSSQWLAEHLADPALRLFDATAGTSVVPPETQAQPARTVFEHQHIPGARYLDLKSELSDPTSPLDFTRLGPERTAAAFAQSGIGTDSIVVVYSSSTYGWATRIWWLLNDIGFTRVAVLDGGLAKWLQEGRPTESGPVSPHPAAPRLDARAQGLFADLADVSTATGAPGVALVNALSAEHFGGLTPGPHGRRGHIPGSISLPAGALVAPADNSLKPLEDLKARIATLGLPPEADIITYCGSGIAATLDAFVLRAVGYDRVRVYDGSLSEWSQDPTRPVVT